jgi:hypothetical protein
MRVRNEMRLSFLATLFGLFALLLPAASFGQVTTTNMIGTVTDASGATVPGAQVTVTNTGTGYSRNVQSGAQGEYRLEFLPIGNYTVQISASGFKKVVRTEWCCRLTSRHASMHNSNWAK